MCDGIYVLYNRGVFPGFFPFSHRQLLLFQVPLTTCLQPLLIQPDLILTSFVQIISSL